jgi:aryl carrier-like protein
LNREKITFALLKAVPHVKYWWEIFCEQKEIKEPSLFTVMTTRESFRDAIKEQYYPVKDRENMDSIKTTSPSHKQRRTLKRQRNILGSGATSIRSLGITLLTVA